MNVYYVNFYEGGLWTGREPIRVKALSHAEALAAVTSENLLEVGPIWRLRATVSKVAYRGVTRKVYYKS